MKTIKNIMLAALLVLFAVITIATVPQIIMTPTLFAIMFALVLKGIDL